MHNAINCNNISVIMTWKNIIKYGLHISNFKEVFCILLHYTVTVCSSDVAIICMQQK